MFVVSIISALLVTSCDDALNQLAGGRYAPNPTKIITSREGFTLKRALDIPTLVNSPLALLYSAPNLRVFGYRSKGGDWINKIEIWGHDDYPTLLLTLHIGDDLGLLRWEMGEELGMLLSVLYEAPLLEAYLVEQNIIPLVERREREAMEQRGRAVINSRLESLEATNKRHQEEGDLRPDATPLTWDEVFAKKYSVHAATLSPRELPFVQTFLSASGASFFKGWLPAEHKAFAIVNQRRVGDRFLYDFWLHPRLKRSEHPSLPHAGTRIRIESRFNLAWLHYSEPSDIVMVEFESLHRFLDPEDVRAYKTQIGIFKSKQDIPTGVSFREVDPVTGRPKSSFRILARPSH